MRKPDRIVYLDSDVIISFLSGESSRLSTIESFFEEVAASKGAIQIITSVITQAEVSFLIDEKNPQTFRLDAEQRIDEFWRDESLLSLVELNQEITFAARTFQRVARSEGRRPPKPMDALHLATAKWAGALQLFTYNLSDFQPHQHVAGLTVIEPYVNQPRLPGV
jgi:predicted nucleic acid-binding protein